MDCKNERLGNNKTNKSKKLAPLSRSLEVNTICFFKAALPHANRFEVRFLKSYPGKRLDNQRKHLKMHRMCKRALT